MVKYRTKEEALEAVRRNCWELEYVPEAIRMELFAADEDTSPSS